MTEKSHPLRNDRRVAFGLLLTSILAPVFGGLYAGPIGAFAAFVAWMVVVTMPRTIGIRLLKFSNGFFEPAALPFTMVNIVLAILVGSIAFGIDIAFYAALVGVPIVVLTLIVAALEPALEPEGEMIQIPIEASQSRRVRRS